MGKDSDTVVVTRRPLSDDEHLVIGRIVRASADLEDCLNLWICKLSDIDESRAAVLLGRTNISTKLATAEALSKLRAGGAPELHRKAFGPPVDQLLQCRNAVAHGALAGETDDSHLLFVTNVNTEYKEAELQRRADAYSIGTLNVIAMGAELLVSRLDDLLGLAALREKRLWRQIPVQQAGPPKGKKGAKPRRPPKASPAK